jgi:mannose-6-phosphate isomerase
MRRPPTPVTAPTRADETGPVTTRVVAKPWGHELIWAETESYVGKILHINAGQALSVQYHTTKDETIHLLSGEIVYRVQRSGSTDALEDVRLRAGDSFRIGPGTIHQLEAVTDCEVLEVSTPHLDDVVRLRDRYGREGTNKP